MYGWNSCDSAIGNRFSSVWSRSNEWLYASFSLFSETMYVQLIVCPVALLTSSRGNIVSNTPNSFVDDISSAVSQVSSFNFLSIAFCWISPWSTLHPGKNRSHLYGFLSLLHSSILSWCIIKKSMQQIGIIVFIWSYSCWGMKSMGEK